MQIQFLGFGPVQGMNQAQPGLVACLGVKKIPQDGN